MTEGENMLKLIIGLKGTGKTKALIHMVDDALASTKGEVVVIEKGTKLRFDINYQARLIDSDDFLVNDADALYGFVAGILAGNHDVTDLFIDSSLKICNNDLAAFDSLVTKLDVLVSRTGLNVVMTASVAEDAVSDNIKKYIG